MDKFDDNTEQFDNILDFFKAILGANCNPSNIQPTIYFLKLLTNKIVNTLKNFDEDKKHHKIQTLSIHILKLLIGRHNDLETDQWYSHNQENDDDEWKILEEKLGECVQNIIIRIESGDNNNINNSNAAPNTLINTPSNLNSLFENLYEGYL